MRQPVERHLNVAARAWLIMIVSLSLPTPATLARETGQHRGAHYGATTAAERQACEKAYEALPATVTQSVLHSGNPNDFLPYKTRLLAYDRACYKPWDTLRPQTRAAVGNMVGFFFLKEDGAWNPVGAGFRISTALVVTARHCLYAAERMGAILIDPTQYEFRLLAAPARAFHSTGSQSPHTSQDPLTDSSDYLVLKVDTTTVPFNSRQVVLRSDVPYREILLIPGISVYSYWFRQKMRIESWPAAVRIDKSPSCTRFPFPMTEGTPAEIRRCILTQCQTLQAMSGAPIVGYDPATQQLLVGGIHLRSGPEPRPECGNQQGFNVGVTLPAEILQLAGGG